ncbi:MAG: ABC transporter ATP-binding protein [Bacteroidota bacterium]|jgi:ABC-type multidrug transport system fused ATPase/permease subunit
MAKKKTSEDDNLPKFKFNKESLKKTAKIYDFLAPFKWKFFVGLICLVGTGLTAIAFPKLMGSLIDASNISLEQINSVGFYLILLFAIQAIFSFFRVVLFVEVTEGMLASMRNATYSNLIQLPMVFFSNRRVGELNSRLSSDLSQIQDTFTTNIAEFLRQLIIIIGGITALFFTSIKLALAMLAVIPLVAIIAVVFGRYIRNYSKKVQDKIAESNTIVDETLQGIANVKSFVNEWFEIKRYKNSTGQIKEIAIKGGRLRGAFFSFIIFCLFGAIILLIWYAVRLESQGELSHGLMIQFMLYTVFVGASIGGIAEQYAQIQKALGATERVLDLLSETREQITIDANAETFNNLPRLKGEVEFSNVTFAYPARNDSPVLRDFSFKAKIGQSIAIVGPSGAGKSTIISLLLQFYHPQNGKIIFDGKNSSEFSLSHLRNNMAIVPQDVLLFGGTIKENIAYGMTNATDAQIEDAARKANAHLFIDSFPEKYNTVVGERGVKLSGGQRQRIAIARAVLKNPAILLLDEATSSLDSESERLVQEALDLLMVGRTTFIVAHRLSTIRNADLIMVIDKGALVELGSHQELIANENGLYRQLSKLQYSVDTV